MGGFEERERIACALAGGGLITMDEAAAHLRVSRRLLQSIVKKHPYYREAGRKKLFTKADIDQLLDAMKPAAVDGGIAAPPGDVRAMPEPEVRKQLKEILERKERPRSRRGRKRPTAVRNSDGP